MDDKERVELIRELVGQLDAIMGDKPLGVVLAALTQFMAIQLQQLTIDQRERVFEDLPSILEKLSANIAHRATKRGVN